ncbi:MAG: hypothetical protein AB4080_26675 [Trichodesmium sp.]
MLKKVLWVRVGDRRQETGEKVWERGGRSKNCKNDFSAQLLPKYPPF